MINYKITRQKSEIMKIKTAIVGIGNCFSALWQGIENKTYTTLFSDKIGKYSIEDIEFVVGFDVSKHKINKPLHEAIYAPPNYVNWTQITESKGQVYPGPILDGVGKWVEEEFAPHDIEKPLDEWRKECVSKLKESEAEVLVSYLPVGSEKASKFWAEVALEAKVGYINAIPSFIVSTEEWDRKFREAKIAAIGDDMKGQIGATILHRWIVQLMNLRKLKIKNTYQLNVGGNTDFKNMLERERLSSKKVSKTEAVRRLAPHLNAEDISVGPSDHIPYLKNTKICYINATCHMWGNVETKIECKLEVDDKANAAPIIADAIRIVKAAMDKGIYGTLAEPSAYLMKTPIREMPDAEAYEKTMELIKQLSE